MSWLRFSKNIILLFYLLSVLLISSNLAIAIVYLNYEYTDDPNLVRPARSLPGLFASGDVYFSLAYASTSILSFVTMWIASVLLLRNYSSLIGKIKFWILVCVPLIYFLSQFQSLFLYSFIEFRISDPVLFGIIYNLIFAATKPIAALLFGMAFWRISRTVLNSLVRKYMIISAYGITLLFTANQPLGLLSTPYPPFGLATVCYVGLASYLMLIGIYSSAVSVANDSLLRRNIRKSVNQNADLLGNIGTAQMQGQIEGIVLEKSKDLLTTMGNQSGIEASMDDEEIRELYINGDR